MKPVVTKHGIKHDYRGAQVALTIRGKTLLGEVVEFYKNEFLNQWFFKVKHFNGADWPFDPAVMAVDVLEREYENESDCIAEFDAALEKLNNLLGEK